MPLYEINLITRPLAKANLIKALTRAGATLQEHGAVITDCESLGYRDLPFRRIVAQTKEQVYTANQFLFRAYMPRLQVLETNKLLRHDLDFVHVHSIVLDKDVTTELSVAHKKTPSANETECNLHEILKPVVERESVENLRKNQRVGHFTRMVIYKKTEKEWRSVPKSWTIAPPRK